MIRKDDPRRRKAEIIAACVTFGVALVILILLFVLTVGRDRTELAEASIPEIQDTEEVYLEPDLLMLEDVGEPESTEADAPAPETPGVPELAPEENPQQEIPNKTEPKNSTAPKPPVVASENPSPVKKQDPPLSPADSARIARSKSGLAASPNPGSNSGKTADKNGAGGTGVGINGQLNGRTFYAPAIQSPTGNGTSTVQVRVLVGANGKVKDAKLQSASRNATQDDKNKCISMALNARWSEKAGAPDEWGVINFTITHPRK